MKKLPLILLFLVLFSLLAMNTAKNRPLTAKDIERQLVKVTDTLYVSKFECSNKIYNTFLADLLAKGLTDEYMICLTDTSVWTNVLPSHLINANSFNYYFSSYYNEYPVVAISHNAAQIFCRWLTKWYLSQPDVRYKNISFSLPTQEEWKKATTFPKESVFPWSGRLVKEKGGKYNANYNPVVEEEGVTENECSIFYTNPMLDGYEFLAPVETYKPNGRRLYNLSGNVAEMLNEPGIHKGGSWNSPGYMLRVDAPDEYAGVTTAHPCIGFRFVAHIYRNAK